MLSSWGEGYSIALSVLYLEEKTLLYAGARLFLGEHTELSQEQLIFSALYNPMKST